MTILAVVLPVRSTTRVRDRSEDNRHRERASTHGRVGRSRPRVTFTGHEGGSRRQVTSMFRDAEGRR